MQVLAADDDPVIREILKAQLQAWDYEPVLCEDGNCAWERLGAEGGPQLALLDWMMPGLDGPEICRRARASARADRVYLILLTSKGRREDVVRGLEAGADDYVVKPFDEAELRARLRVGRRVVELWRQILQAERDRVLAEAAGAAAHEIRQPLATILAAVQLSLRKPDLPESLRAKLELVAGGVADIDRTISRMSATDAYTSRAYGEKGRIADFGESD